jgi:hypothetical protein
MRTLLERLRLTGSVAAVRIDGSPPATWDCDTTSDLNRVRALACVEEG